MLQELAHPRNGTEDGSAGTSPFPQRGLAGYQRNCRLLLRFLSAASSRAVAAASEASEAGSGITGGGFAGLPPLSSSPRSPTSSRGVRFGRTLWVTGAEGGSGASKESTGSACHGDSTTDSSGRDAGGSTGSRKTAVITGGSRGGSFRGVTGGVLIRWGAAVGRGGI